MTAKSNHMCAETQSCATLVLGYYLLANFVDKVNVIPPINPHLKYYPSKSKKGAEAPFML
jgi:hypothetical protein